MKEYTTHQLHELTSEILDRCSDDRVIKIVRGARGDRGHMAYYLVSQEAMTGQAREAIIEAYQPRTL